MLLTIVGLPRALIHIAPHFQYLIFYSSKTAMMLNFGDHRLRTHGDRRFIDRRSCWPSWVRSFLLTIHQQLWSSVLQVRWWCITSATTDYARMENAASSTDDLFASKKTKDWLDRAYTIALIAPYSFTTGNAHQRIHHPISKRICWIYDNSSTI